MGDPTRLIAAFDECLQLVEDGATIDEALRAHPDMRAELEPLLRDASLYGGIFDGRAPRHLAAEIDAALVRAAGSRRDRAWAKAPIPALAGSVLGSLRTIADAGRRIHVGRRVRSSPSTAALALIAALILGGTVALAASGGAPYVVRAIEQAIGLAAERMLEAPGRDSLARDDGGTASRTATRIARQHVEPSTIGTELARGPLWARVPTDGPTVRAGTRPDSPPTPTAAGQGSPAPAAEPSPTAYPNDPPPSAPTNTSPPDATETPATTPTPTRVSPPATAPTPGVTAPPTTSLPTTVTSTATPPATPTPSAAPPPSEAPAASPTPLPSRSISGTITDADGRPIPGAEVIAYRISGTPDEPPWTLGDAFVRYAGSDGRFRIHVEPGFYVVGAGSPERLWWRDESVPEFADPVEVTPDEGASGIDFELNRR